MVVIHCSTDVEFMCEILLLLLLLLFVYFVVTICVFNGKINCWMRWIGLFVRSCVCVCVCVTGLGPGSGGLGRS